MATLTLNIYGRGEEKNTVVKKYTAEGYDLTLGTVTDILELVNADNMTDEKKIAAAAVKGAKEISPLLKDIFPGVTDEELRQVKAKELIPLFVQIAREALGSFDTFKKGN
ncbi:MAG: hypothetical protein J6Y26_05420 [Lachnospiraceae bacterium]|nr:hypothetical protein [Lachnospiraceae bacterium]